MTARTNVRTVIDVVPGVDVGLSRGSISLVFESRDIGYTQGATLRYGGGIVARYRPGTSSWDSALRNARDLLAKAMDLTVADGQPFIFKTFMGHFREVMAADGCTPWDGTGIDPFGEEE